MTTTRQLFGSSLREEFSTRASVSQVCRERQRRTKQGDITLNGYRWAPGLIWSHNGPDGVLRYETAKRDRNVEIDLSLFRKFTCRHRLLGPTEEIRPPDPDLAAGAPEKLRVLLTAILARLAPSARAEA